MLYYNDICQKKNAEANSIGAEGCFESTIQRFKRTKKKKRTKKRNEKE